MDYNDTVAYLFSLHRLDNYYDLGQMRRALEALGQPQHAYRSVHIAGSTGKGSTAAMLASVLQSAGYRTGLYTSPHLVDFRERIKVDGQQIGEQDVIRLFQTLRMLGLPLTFFEYVTAMAFLYFQERKVGVAVVEVGLGGRLDATNLIQPVLSIITSISLEHTDILGPTIAAIATEKAGIIKESVTVIANVFDPALEVISGIAKQRNSRLVTDLEKVRRKSTNMDCQLVAYQGHDITLPLLGSFQLRNLSLALTAVRELNGLGMPIGMEAVRNGIETVSWPGRLEVVRQRPLIIIDGAHNSEGMASLANEMARMKRGRLVCLVAIMKDKDKKTMLESLNQVADRFVFTTASTPRSADPADLAKHVSKPYLLESDVTQALRLAEAQCRPGDTLLITGSLYLAGDVKAMLGGKKAMHAMEMAVAK
ncbi:MAG: bifunctional folylpolyglutamate synthase/dihydrofolate synthase [Candidatus Aenigmarchaeota archaeon]|nr:bifunctional folylpolyglutamate synthase/dihydrofolate synthase [Candidatus Aenigmarchaeota archaeon]